MNRLRIHPLRSVRLLAPLTLCLVAAGVLIAATASGQSSRGRIVELGRTPVNQVQASCPRNCEAVGRVTGYQLLAGGRRNAYRVPSSGRIVAWTIKIANPSRSQTAFFTDFYGGAPQARLAILSPGGGSVLSLAAQGPAEPLREYLGERVTFVLDDPISVRRGQLVGLTTSTWVPAFATRLSREDAWRASRRSNRCADVRRNSAHTTRTRRTYGCVYRTARLLYTAHFVPRR